MGGGGGGGRGPARTQVGGCRQERAPLRRRGVQRRAGRIVPAPSPGAACERRKRASRGGTRGERSPPGGAGEGHLLPPAAQPVLGSSPPRTRRRRRPEKVVSLFAKASPLTRSLGWGREREGQKEPLLSWEHRHIRSDTKPGNTSEGEPSRLGRSSGTGLTPPVLANGAVSASECAVAARHTPGKPPAKPIPSFPRTEAPAAGSGTGHRCACHRRGCGCGADERRWEQPCQRRPGATPCEREAPGAPSREAPPPTGVRWGRKTCEAVAAGCSRASPGRGEERRSSLPPAVGEPPSRRSATPYRERGGRLPAPEGRQGIERSGATDPLRRLRRDRGQPGPTHRAAAPVTPGQRSPNAAPRPPRLLLRPRSRGRRAGKNPFHDRGRRQQCFYSPAKCLLLEMIFTLFLKSMPSLLESKWLLVMLQIEAGMAGGSMSFPVEHVTAGTCSRSLNWGISELDWRILVTQIV
ncbi:collagen alpha-2(I) chain-like [Aphelocoma coerulescens]|uniref:collagen alpha-2(I) chain-like n=1 Tax=Aphelocoma coerulescens TaxID=39617 RepID=UPI00360517E7